MSIDRSRAEAPLYRRKGIPRQSCLLLQSASMLQLVVSVHLEAGV